MIRIIRIIIFDRKKCKFAKEMGRAGPLLGWDGMGEVLSGRTVRQLSSCGGRMKDSGPPSDSHIKCLGMFQTNIPGHVMVSWADAELQTVSTALFSFHTIFLRHAMRSVTQSIRTSTFVYSALLLRSPTEVHLVFQCELQGRVR